MFIFPKKAVQSPAPEPENVPPEPDVVISGAMRGSILGHSDIKVDVKGHCEGNLNARELNIFGTVVGNICVDELIVHPSGRLYYGHVTAKNTVIHEGAVYVERLALQQEVQKQEGNTINPAVAKLVSQRAKDEQGIEEAKKRKGPNFVNTY